MPIYEYECPKCGEFEVTQRITEDPLKRCPTCRHKVKKLISRSSFHLKGSGWYLTDYARKDNGGHTGEAAASKEASAAHHGSNGNGNGNGSKKSESAGKESKTEKKASKKEGASAST